MARKFNIGRQGEQLLNEEWHNLFMSLKYLNYNRYIDFEDEDINPERQTKIPNHALRLQQDRYNRDLLTTFYPTQGVSGEWRPVFENYYHPANSSKPTGNDFVDYRLCIDPKTGAIMYWDPSSRSWLVARAQEYNGELSSFNGLNFQFITDLKQATDKAGDLLNVYPVPYVNYGKLFASEDLNYVPEETIFEEVTPDRLNLKLSDEKIESSTDVNYTIKPEYCEEQEININILTTTADVNLTHRGRYVNISDYSPEDGTILENNYSSINGCAISLLDDSLNGLSWVHINASKLTKIEKRLIEVSTEGFINIVPTQTEFYGFKADYLNIEGCSRLGTLLLQGENEEDLENGYDYIGVMGGIQLSDEICKNKKYDFIYSLTYIFDDYPNSEGYVTIGMSAVGQNYQIYIGNRVEAPIALFLDGLSLEEKNEFGEAIYTHDPNEGVLTFTDQDDAEIINNMQMAVLAFSNKTEEFTLTNEGSNGNVVINEDSVCVTIDVEIKNGNTAGAVPGYKQPMVFCSGLGLQETTIFEDFTINDVTYNANHTSAKVTLEIKGLVLPNEPVKGFLADIGDSFTCKGKLYNGKTDNNENISEDTDYVVFVNGLLLTPTNGDMSIKNGYIEITNTEDLDDTLLDYVVLEVDNNDDDKLGLIFDDTVSYYSTRIDDGGDKAVYNDCNDAIVYIQDGVILDLATLDKPINAIEGYYKGNQIIRIPVDDNNSSYKYYKYDFTQDEPEEITDERKIELLEYMVGYYATTGSIHLLGNNEMWEGCAMGYYAYSFANMIDEPMTYGRREDLIIPVNDDNKKQIYNGKSSRVDAWTKNCGALSTYINGLIIENEEMDSDADGLVRDYRLQYPKLDVPTIDYYGQDTDIAFVLEQMYNKFKEIKDAKEERVSFSLSFESLIEDERIMEWELAGKTVSNYFPTELLAIEALQLAVYIFEDMQHESTSYVIERLERSEFLSAYRDFIDLDVGEGNDHSQIFKSINDTIETDFKLAPATVNVYQNGVLLESSEYCRFNNNKVMFNTDVCGLQQLPDLQNMMFSVPEHVSEDLRYELENILYKKKNVLRIIEDKAYYIPTSRRDTILIEKRDDTLIRSVTYEIQRISYDTYEFTQDFYDIPDSLMNTADYIKIYINGVRYEGEYILTRTGGIKGIKLLEANCLVIDPIYTYFNMNPKELIKYQNTYNKDYIRQVDKITFEWR